MKVCLKHMRSFYIYTSLRFAAHQITRMPPMLIVTVAPLISIPRCILLAANFLGNIPDAEVFVTSASRLKDVGRQRLPPDEKQVASRIALWSDECCARANSSSAPVIVVLDPFEASASGSHKELFASLKAVKCVFLVASAIECFRKNARAGHQARVFTVCLLIKLMHSRRQLTGYTQSWKQAG